MPPPPSTLRSHPFQELQKRMARGVVIHRTRHNVVISESEEVKKQRQQREKERGERGWNAPESKTYQPLGDFEDVL